MSLIRSKNTKFEEKCFILLRTTKFRFRKHPKGIYGNPDAANKRRKVAIFFDSDFWHGYNWKERKKDFRSRKNFWKSKIERNIVRDKTVSRELRKRGWKVVRLWEHELHPSHSIQTKRKLMRVWNKATVR